jgi:hypothetical protein
LQARAPRGVDPAQAKYGLDAGTPPPALPIVALSMTAHCTPATYARLTRMMSAGGPLSPSLTSRPIPHGPTIIFLCLIFSSPVLYKSVALNHIFIGCARSRVYLRDAGFLRRPPPRLTASHAVRRATLSHAVRRATADSTFQPPCRLRQTRWRERACPANSRSWRGPVMQGS